MTTSTDTHAGAVSSMPMPGWWMVTATVAVLLSITGVAVALSVGTRWVQVAAVGVPVVSVVCLWAVAPIRKTARS